MNPENKTKFNLNPKGSLNCAFCVYHDVIMYGILLLPDMYPHTSEQYSKLPKLSTQNNQS